MSFLFRVLLLTSLLNRPACLAVPLSGEPGAPPRTALSQRLAYGPDSPQHGELRLPAGRGPFPVVVLLHGGCWLAQYDLHGLDSLSASLTRAGYATWNLEYRRVGDAGGGWPGTFLDVAAGTDYVRELARRYPLLLSQVVVLGHSAGGSSRCGWRLARNCPATARSTSPIR